MINMIDDRIRMVERFSDAVMEHWSYYGKIRWLFVRFKVLSKICQSLIFFTTTVQERSTWLTIETGWWNRSVLRISHGSFYGKFQFLFDVAKVLSKICYYVIFLRNTLRDSLTWLTIGPGWWSFSRLSTIAKPWIQSVRICSSEQVNSCFFIFSNVSILVLSKISFLESIVGQLCPCWLVLLLNYREANVVWLKILWWSQ